MMEDCRGLVLRHCNIFFFFILVAWGVDLTYRYVIDKNIFFWKKSQLPMEMDVANRNKKKSIDI